MASTGIAPIRDIIRVFVKHAMRHRLLMFLALFGTVATQIGSILAPLYIAQFFNKLVEFSETRVQAEGLYSALALVGFFLLLAWASRRVRGISTVLFETRTMNDLYLSSFNYLIRHSHHFFATQFAGTLTRRVSKYAHAFEQLFDSLAMVFLPTFVYAVGVITVLYFRSPMLGIILGVWSIVFVAFQVTVSHLRQPIRIARSEADSSMVGGIADAVGNQHSIMLFARAKHELSRFRALVASWRDITQRSWVVDEYIWAAQGLFLISIQMGLLGAAVYFWKQGQLEIGDFVLIQVYIFGLIEHLEGVTRELRRVYDAIADAGEMVAILSLPHDIKDSPKAKELAVSQARIRFDNVTFSYEEDGGVMRNLSLDIEPKQKVGIVGKSGAGKSTIMKLLSRQYDVQGGTITIDGEDIAAVTQESLRSALSLVPQEPLLFHRAISENIAYGKLGATQEEIERAARLAHAHDFIEKLPKGYGSFVGERGIKLSGGERQRVTIARAILKDAPILLLDEATSALDSESEVAIQKALHELMQGKTVIAIAHRLSTLREMDRILVLDKGEIVEDGSHDELVAKSGVYAELWAHQAGGFIQDE